ncbi:hypothetical protein ACF064_32580 [Streptomyces sp. NPDC015492]|uniref:hypothetical protein n=1 Tax=Streptomyces sp. NPDC015492 TaxID=3364958 RepID=UPI0036FA59D9
MTQPQQSASAQTLRALTPTQVAALPIDALARSVVLDMTRSGRATVSLKRWASGIRQAYRGHPQALRAISESVAWLRHHMALVDDLGVGLEGDWITLSRHGAQWLHGGTPGAP